MNILKSWFDSYWMENHDEASCELLRRVYAFAQDSVATTNTPGAGPLKQVIEQRLKGQEATSKRLIPNVNPLTPVPNVPKNLKKLKFLDIDITEFARQLTIIESRLYGKIKPAECLNRTWPGSKRSHAEDESSPNIRALILHSNQLTNWVAEMILTQADAKKRVVVIKHFVSVADVSPITVKVAFVLMLMAIEMSAIEQFLYCDSHHVCSWHCADTSPQPHMVASQRSDVCGIRFHAEADGEYQELCRIPRDLAQCPSTMYPIFRYYLLNYLT